MTINLVVDGLERSVERENVSLLEALREDLGVSSAKDGCSPQGQCGCCTVLVDGKPRVACVTPLRRVAGRSVTTVEGLEPSLRSRLVGAFLANGASQCGFCTPGILCRLAPFVGSAPGERPDGRARVESDLLAHLCRCTGWRTVVQAALEAAGGGPAGGATLRDWGAASARATLEGGQPQLVGPDAVLGRGGFADDLAPAGSLVAVPDGRGGWALGETLAEAREAAGKVQGRRSGKRLVWPVELPPGDWDLTLQTTWVEPAYLETDASWCEPGGEPASPLANGGAFGAKQTSIAPAAAKQLADRFGRPVRVLLSREDTVRMGPKRPPLAAGLRSDGSGSVRLVGAPGVAEAFARVAPALAVEEVSVGGLAVSASIRAAGAAEAAVLLEAARAVREGRVPSSAGGSGEASVRLPGCGRATAAVALDGRGWPARVSLLVDCGDPLDHVVVRSYCVGAAHMALGWVCSEGIAVGEDGMPEDLTIRSFGILRARETPPIEVELVGRPGPPLRCSDSAFAAVAAAAWIALGLPPRWPVYPGGKP